MGRELLTVAESLFSTIERCDRQALLGLYAEDAVQSSIPTG